MSIQILDIVIYSAGHAPRSISLKPGEVNIITGESGTGKSSLIDIIDYCLGSGACNIPHGIMARTIHWYGLRLTDGVAQHFVARRAPDPGKRASSDAYYATGSGVTIPPYSELGATTNIEAVLARIQLATGIGAHRHTPPEGQTRRELSASIRHAMAFVFQKQTEISQPGFLLHGQGDHFVAQGIKDTFAYFIGAMEDDHIELSAKLRDLRRDLRLKESELARSIALTSDARLDGLLAEAKGAGLIDVDRQATTYDETVNILEEASKAPFEDQLSRVETQVDQAALERLVTDRTALRSRLHLLNDEVKAVSSLRIEGGNFARESAEQVARLESLGLVDVNEHACPLCHHELSSAVPSIQELRTELESARNQLETVIRHTPGLDALITEKSLELEDVKQSLRENWRALEALRASDNRLQSMRDTAARRAHVLGRIALTLESLPVAQDSEKLRSEAETLRAEIERLSDLLSDDSVRERTASVMSRLATLMTSWAKFLELEHSGVPFRLDPKKLLVVADTDEGLVPMNRMGSGETWLGCHLIALLALHDYFARKERPVPRFLILDQPSQVYFPSERGRDVNKVDEEDEDRLAVIRIFQLISNVVHGLAPRMQVIVTEHADIQEPWYQAMIVERWRDGKALVPASWDEGPTVVP